MAFMHRANINAETKEKPATGKEKIVSMTLHLEVEFRTLTSPPASDISDSESITVCIFIRFYL
jgi:hypothetical protein